MAAATLPSYSRPRPTVRGAQTPLELPQAPPYSQQPTPLTSGGGFEDYFSDPMLSQYLGFSQDVMGRLRQPQGINPTLQSAIDALMGMTGGGGGGNAGMDQFQGIANRRLSQLRQPLFGLTGGAQQGPAEARPTPSSPQPGADWVPNQSGDGWVPADHASAWVGSGSGAPDGAPSADSMVNSAVLRTAFLEPLESQRKARLEQEQLRLSSRGLTPDSGIFQDRLSDVNRGYDQQRTEGYRDLLLHEIGANEGREQEAVNIGQLLASLGLQSEGLANQRTGMRLSAAGQLGGIGQGLQGLDESRLLQALGISGNLAMLPFQTMNYGLGALNQLQGGIPQDDSGGILQLLMMLAGAGENARLGEMGQNQNFWTSLIQAIPGIVGAFQPQQPQQPARARG